MDVVVLLTVFECVSVVRRSCCCWSPSDGEWGLRRNQIGVGVSSPHGPTRQGLKVSWAGGLAGLWWLPWHGICVCSNTSVCRGCAFVVYERILFFSEKVMKSVSFVCMLDPLCPTPKGDNWLFMLGADRMYTRERRWRTVMTVQHIYWADADADASLEWDVSFALRLLFIY